MTFDGERERQKLDAAFDYVIIGSGAAGATAARVLSDTDATIAVVEEGPTVRTSDFGDKVYRTQIPRNVRLSESPSHGKPILLYDLRSRGCQSYLELAREFIARRGDVRIAPEPDTIAS